MLQVPKLLLPHQKKFYLWAKACEKGHYHPFRLATIPRVSTFLNVEGVPRTSNCFRIQNTFTSSIYWRQTLFTAYLLALCTFCTRQTEHFFLAYPERRHKGSVSRGDSHSHQQFQVWWHFMYPVQTLCIEIINPATAKACPADLPEEPTQPTEDMASQSMTPSSPLVIKKKIFERMIPLEKIFQLFIPILCSTFNAFSFKFMMTH